jgi:hypothetical protein
MTLVISKGITLRKGYIGTDDPDAEAYIAAVEAADEAESPGVGALETATKVAIHSFVKGCKNDGIWPAIKASCILAGARTLAGALVPLAGTAPTNVGGLFVSGDYDRKMGLVGNGSTKYLNSNRAGNADPLDSQHLSIYITELNTGANAYLAGAATAAGASELFRAGNSFNGKIQSNVNVGDISVTTAPQLLALSRASNSSVIQRCNATSTIRTNASTSASTFSHFIFARNNTGAVNQITNPRLAFYSIGESLDLALLDARVTDLINAFGAAIP